MAALRASVTGLGVQLAWTAPASTMPASYRVSRRVNGGDWKLLDQGASSTFIDSAAPPGGGSDYKVAAVDPEGLAGFASSPVSGVVPDIVLAQTEDGHGPPAPPRPSLAVVHR